MTIFRFISIGTEDNDPSSFRQVKLITRSKKFDKLVLHPVLIQTNNII